MSHIERTDFNPPRSSRGVRSWATSDLMQAGSLWRLACFFWNIWAKSQEITAIFNTVEVTG